MSRHAASASASTDETQDVSDEELLGAIDDLGAHRPGGDDDEEELDPDPVVETTDDVDDEDEEAQGAEGSADDDEDEEAAAPAGGAAVAETTEGAAAPLTRDDGAQWNASAKRWQKDGKFVEGEAPAPPGGAGAAAAAAAKPAQDTAAAGWEPMAITVDRAKVAIPEAQMSRANGHVIIGIPEAKFAEFQSRISKGVVAERNWRQINEGLRQLEDEKRLAKERPAVRSDSEVEADILMEALKPYLGKLYVPNEEGDGVVPFLDPKSLENLGLKVEIAQGKERQKIAAWETERQSRTAEQQTDERTQLEGIANTLIELVDDPQYAAEFKALDEDDLKAVMGELRGISRAVYWKEGKEWLRNTQLVYDRLKARAQAKAGGKPAPATGSSTGTAATDATPPAGGTTASGAAKPGDRAERFNKGQDTAAKPTTTSVKARRTAGTNRPSASGTAAGHHRDASVTKDRRTPQQKAEDEARAVQRRYLNSPTLDIEGDDD